MPDADSLTVAKSPPSWAADLFPAGLVATAGASNPDAPVWSIVGDRIGAQISDQFTANAGEYHARYAASAHFQELFRQTLAKTGVKIAEAPLIFDMGSGSGVNSIVPCFNLFPGARQVATDLSADLLFMLADYASREGLSDRVTCVVMDAMSAQTAPGRFDLVTGASILHHLMRPVQGLNAAARALKPGGHAIFFEPFDGYGLIRLAYERILAEADLRGDPLDPAAAHALRGISEDIAARTDPDPRSPEFAALDDKWLFSREFLTQAARDCGFTDVKFLSHNNHQTFYRDLTFVQLRLAAGRDDLTLPDWAVRILDDFDTALPRAVKNLLMLEGSVVLTKGG